MHTPTTWYQRENRGRARLLLALIVAFGLLTSTARAFPCGASVKLGIAWNVPTNLLVVQKDQPDITVAEARFSTRPFEGSWYYAIRGWCGEPAGWRVELELVHNKLYFEGARDGAGPIERLDATDGFNLLFLNVARFTDLGPARAGGRIGIGVSLPHSSATRVRGLDWGVDGDPAYYQVGGLAFQLAAAAELPVWGRLGPEVEAKFTIAPARLRIADGYVWGVFRAVHLLLGLGI